MSLLAPAESASSPAPALAPVVPADARAAFHAALAHVEDAFTVAVQHADTKTAAAMAQLAELSVKHETLAKSHADLEAKFAVLKELRAKLDAL